MTDRFDAVVIGAGAMGAATAWALAAQGREPLVLERFRVGHDRGSSHGPTRIFRLSYHHPDYVRMARRALEAWRELEEAAGERLLYTLGGLDLGPGARVAAAALEASGEGFAWLSSGEAEARWPGLHLEPGREVLYQADAGVCMAERAVRAMARMAVRAGATLLEETPAEAVVRSGHGVEVRTPGQTFRTPIVVVTAGAWAGPLLEEAGLDLPLTVSKEQVSYFVQEPASGIPVFIEWSEPPEPPRYAMPNPEERGAVKLAEHRTGPQTTADSRTFEPEPGGVARVVDWAGRRFRGLSLSGTETCLYTNTPDEDFVLDRRGPIVVGSACSGHGFKFAPFIGRVLAALALGQEPAIPRARFSARRPALTDPAG